MRDAGAQQRVGQQAHAANFDQDGGVAEENNTVSRRAFRTGHGRVIGHGWEGSNEMTLAIEVAGTGAG
jgi:hypothetical protein